MSYLAIVDPPVHFSKKLEVNPVAVQFTSEDQYRLNYTLRIKL